MELFAPFAPIRPSINTECYARMHPESRAEVENHDDAIDEASGTVP